ncbi:hypothetical protein H4P35_13650 [Achromobacter sp. 77]|uniref:hypothetical protein n=1 Tax=Achromobacter sp. 77 TaxID=2756133 RepID=UPI001D01EE43|nr:hypothetical protein [Achromobacter sp. 77]UDG73326.1 hypothetical protein H4P35_13650 [Achromobacter sp. 77]
MVRADAGGFGAVGSGSRATAVALAKADSTASDPKAAAANKDFIVRLHGNRSKPKPGHDPSVPPNARP